MLVGVIQSGYIPWRGYFDFIDSVDLFVVYDDVQFTEHDWRNRNQIRTEQGKRWLTVPVNFKYSERTFVQDTPVNNIQPWRKAHLKWIELSYKKAPFFDHLIDEFRDELNAEHRTISELNCALIRWINRLLGITTPLIMSSELSLEGARTDRLIDLFRKVGATHYLSGRSASDYLEIEKFARAGIGLSFKSYTYEPYSQLFSGFEPNVSVIDLLFNCGPDGGKRYLKSLDPDEVIVESEGVQRCA